jgi:hypothetical protein
VQCQRPSCVPPGPHHPTPKPPTRLQVLVDSVEKERRAGGLRGGHATRDVHLAVLDQGSAVALELQVGQGQAGRWAGRWAGGGSGRVGGGTQRKLRSSCREGCRGHASCRAHGAALPPVVPAARSCRQWPQIKAGRPPCWPAPPGNPPSAPAARQTASNITMIATTPCQS